MNLRFYPRHFTLDPRQKPTLFFTLSRAYELSLAFQHFIFMTPRQPFSAVLGWIWREIWILLSNSLPEDSDDFFRQKSIFLLTDECVLDFCCCVVLCFAGRNIYFPAS